MFLPACSCLPSGAFEQVAVGAFVEVNFRSFIYGYGGWLNWRGFLPRSAIFFGRQSNDVVYMCFHTSAVRTAFEGGAEGQFPFARFNLGNVRLNVVFFELLAAVWAPWFIFIS